ncbi:MAG: adenylate kinase [Dysgonamonadaceae bacterium]|jgi:adenylate kinase|nr:adenylate kinase [Dysgonamonadaceae bacterium]
MLNVVIFGAPGSGKGTQSELIIRKYGLFHISTGDILRAEIEKHSELGTTADMYIKEGKLVPDQFMIEILTQTIEANLTAKGFIFDGFPRTLAQGEALENLLRERNTNVVAVLNLDVEEDELVKRMLNRGKETGRSDDNLYTIKNRLNVYNIQTEPLKTFYRKKGKLFSIKGKDDVNEVFESVSEVLDRLAFKTRK